MKIGIDMTPLQNGHRMRGIGSTLANFISNISEEDRRKNTYIFYMTPSDDIISANPLLSLDLHSMNYEIRFFNEEIYSLSTEKVKISLALSIWRSFNKTRQSIQRKFPSKIQRTTRGIKNILIKVLYLLRTEDSMLINTYTKDIDIYMQFDPLKKVLNRRLKIVLILYDIIPYILEWDYLWSYSTSRRKGLSIKESINKHIHRWLYIVEIRINIKKASTLLAISSATKKDFVKYARIDENKIVVTPLGINKPTTKHTDKIKLYRYFQTPWGNVKRNIGIDDLSPYVLYVGGADARRKLEDLVTAFNILKAQGHKIKLVLVGDIMYGPDSIPTEPIRNALLASSYPEDIIFMGYVNEKQRDWLYGNALAFVFPSRYEGFGLPPLEAMVHECPVISYPNDATKEVAGDSIMYANSSIEISELIETLLFMSDNDRRNITNKGLEKAKEYSWSKTAIDIMKAIEL